MRAPFLPSLFVVLAVVVSAAVAAPPEDVFQRPRMEAMLDAGDTDMIVQTFRRYPDQTLPFIDSYFEGGLKMIEEGGSLNDANASYRIGVQFAKLADEAFRESIFLEYGASFGSWSPIEQTMFREGQSEYRTGRQAMADPAQALKHFERSAALADQLLDSWGSAMAYGGMARAHLALGDYEAANKAALRSIQLNSRLRLRRSEVAALLACGEARGKLGLPDAGVGHYRKAWELLTDEDPVELRRETLTNLLAALESVGRTEEAEKFREEGAAVLAPAEG